MMQLLREFESVQEALRQKTTEVRRAFESPLPLSFDTLRPTYGSLSLYLTKLTSVLHTIIAKNNAAVLSYPRPGWSISQPQQPPPQQPAAVVVSPPRVAAPETRPRPPIVRDAAGQLVVADSQGQRLTLFAKVVLLCGSEGSQGHKKVRGNVVGFVDCPATLYEDRKEPMLDLKHHDEVHVLVTFVHKDALDSPVRFPTDDARKFKDCLKPETNVIKWLASETRLGTAFVETAN